MSAPISNYLPNENPLIIDGNKSAAWGSYLVSKTGDYFAYKIFVKDHRHRLIKEIDCGDCLGVFTAQINPTGAPDLFILASDGSNVICCQTTFIFSQGRQGVRNVAIITGGGGDFEYINGRLLYVMDPSAILEWSCDLCHACEPRVPLILGWRNGHTTDVTARYPHLLEKYVEDYRQKFLSARAGWTKDEGTDTIISPASGYYANEYELGHGRDAYIWIVSKLSSSSAKSYFADCAKNIRYEFSQVSYITTVNQNRILTVDREKNIFYYSPNFPGFPH